MEQLLYRSTWTTACVVVNTGAKNMGVGYDEVCPLSLPSIF